MKPASDYLDKLAAQVKGGETTPDETALEETTVESAEHVEHFKTGDIDVDAGFDEWKTLMESGEQLLFNRGGYKRMKHILRDAGYNNELVSTNEEGKWQQSKWTADNGPEIAVEYRVPMYTSTREDGQTWEARGTRLHIPSSW
ncbi:MAG: hypothetical protein ACW99G_11365 [Candidatus Thorarchaeota archaeon]|jgi:hypothetical protein